MSDLYRQLPKVDRLLEDARVAALPRAVAVAVARDVLERLRQGIADGTLRALPDVAAEVEAAARILVAGRVRRVWNATGVVVHTNLGRAPWAPEVVAHAAAVAGGYANLEIELDSGRRGGRLDGVRALLAHLTGAEDALVVNNCAAAVLLALTALARGREVVVSRGELVEIGGSFRVPDVIASGGARLVEVGTTNRTRIGDYAAAVGPDTAVLLRIHPSNFRIVGFTERPDVDALVSLARERGLFVLDDAGSGSLHGGRGEPSIADTVGAGVDLVMFSGDKLLGGPQAGIVVGRRDAVQRLRKHPMYRALRVDKVILAALEQTLVLHAAGRLPPVAEMIAADAVSLRARAEALQAALRGRGVACRVEDDHGFVGGGALPMQPLPSSTVVLDAPRPDALARALRVGEPSVVPRVAEDALRLDVRTLPDAAFDEVAARVADAIGRGY